MAGVRKRQLSSGKYQGWYVDYNKKRKFFTGTRSKAETLRIAKRLEDEHLQIRLGYRPKPKSAYKYKQQRFCDVVEEYLAWGESQGGRGGRPWSKLHAHKRRAYLKWWQEFMGFETLGDLDDILAGVEKNLRELQTAGRSGKTLQNYAAGLFTFCNWCVTRGYLPENPLKNLMPFDTSPRTVRRAMTLLETQRLLEVAPEERRLLYEVAFMTGLRAGELRALTVEHLDIERGGLRLDAEWTKNRKPGFQLLPTALLEYLRSFAEAGTAAKLYEKYYRRRDNKEAAPRNALLYITSHPAREMDRDLKAAGIPKYSPIGKIDFHACRVAYITFVIEAGASAKEAQTLARHSTPDITMNLYARTRENRLVHLTEKVAETIFSKRKCAHSVHKQAVGTEMISPNLVRNKRLRSVDNGGGGGNRTPKTPQQNHNTSST